MKRLDPEKLFVEYGDGVSPDNPIVPRRYTLTHSDVTGELFLTVAKEYDLEKVGPMRDEVLAEWREFKDRYVLLGYVCVGRNIDKEKAALRYEIFRRELPLALEAIRYGDRSLFLAHPNLDLSPVFIYFDSSYSDYRGLQGFGIMADYA